MWRKGIATLPLNPKNELPDEIVRRCAAAHSCTECPKQKTCEYYFSCYTEKHMTTTEASLRLLTMMKKLGYLLTLVVWGGLC
jgi:hypothetical protein